MPARSALLDSRFGGSRHLRERNLLLDFEHMPGGVNGDVAGHAVADGLDLVFGAAIFAVADVAAHGRAVALLLLDRLLHGRGQLAEGNVDFLRVRNTGCQGKRQRCGRESVELDFHQFLLEGYLSTWA
ncbi:hypothetical protein ACP_0093 [Acidobacterium capsulatum ATCC 51196]|uniref:Uncharacterized protein n=1 Tax=Acidobacterium capsulatum (strain ATCC 51196 / DSM 11244 / BCRC 80197 / JCM 7670 / NBRC 15755 / NCIMB 13165 / 161) TaxID=240015 RepID=C1F8G9_ACIC5|nr:hypothetical protein ACP_0093 [Acidobacterium capsulatum ATCC 51196]